MSHDLRPGRRGKSFVFERDLKTSSESAEQMCQVWQVIPQPEAQLPSGFQPSVGGGKSSSSQQLIGQSQCSGADAGAGVSSGVPKETESQDWGCVVLVHSEEAWCRQI